MARLGDRDSGRDDLTGYPIAEFSTPHRIINFDVCYAWWDDPTYRFSTGRKEEVMTEAELAIVRRAYAKQVMVPYNAAHPRVGAAFAAVRREAFLGRGHGRSCTRVAM